MRKIYLVIIILFIGFSAKTQILNAYAKISSITGGTSLTVTNVDQTSHTFTVGGKVIIMQMQDNVIGTNTVNASTFGDLSTIANAGAYEVGTISSRSPATGTPTTITLSSPLINTYNTGSNSSLQLISFRNMGTNFTTTANISGLAWNGNIGGIIAFEVTNTLTLNHSVSANVIGFRLGAFNSTSQETGCSPNTYNSNAVTQAFKGEGIYKSTDPTFINARGKIISGGGGGNDDNGGGGGGGNYSAGGNGGFGWGCNASNNSGGVGGIALSSYISANRIFMGGGGGGGQQNNNVSTNGGNGGGIILIKANTLITNTVCSSSISITANGGNTSNSGNDGAGGSGAGGTILLQINNYSLSSTCPLTINANGGNGGSVGNSGAHGGGGGGGQGAIIYAGAQPTINVTASTINGNGGANSNTNSSFAGNGGGPNNGGIIGTSINPLPIELLFFNAEAENTKVKLFWSTATEINNDYFTVEKSADGVTFNNLGSIKAIGNSNTINSYELYDTKPFSGINYYRLKQTDIDGKFSFSKIIDITFNNEITFSIFPNPSNNNEPIYISFNKSNASIDMILYDVVGKEIMTKKINSTDKNNTLILNTIDLAKGIYFIRLFNDNLNQTKKIVIN